MPLIAPPGVGAVPVYDGSLWVPKLLTAADMNSDVTAWTNLSLVAGWVGTSGDVPRYRKVLGGQYLQMTGSVSRTSGSSEQIGTLPAGFRVPYDLWVCLVVSGGGSYFNFLANGAINTNGSSGTTWFSGNPYSITFFYSLLLPLV